MNVTPEGAGGLVIARSNAAILLELGKQVLNHVPGFVQIAVVLTRVFIVAARWNHHRLARCMQCSDYPLMRIVGLAGNDRASLALGQEHIGTLLIMGLPSGEVKPGGVAKCIAGGVDLGAILTLRPQRCAQWPGSPGSFAPALCWWARTMAASIVPHSLSALTASTSNTRCHTPARLQRLWRRCTTRK
jgi:hypothetical protein